MNFIAFEEAIGESFQVFSPNERMPRVRENQCRSVDDAVICCYSLKPGSKNNYRLHRSKDFSENVVKISDDKLSK